MKFERNADNFEREFCGVPETLEKQGRKIRWKNSPSKFAERFAGNFPKHRHAKVINSPPICSAEPRDQRMSTKNVKVRIAMLLRVDDAKGDL